MNMRRTQIAYKVFQFLPSRVIGGTYIQENEYPWLCSLKIRGRSGSYNHACGVTLISAPPRDTILVGAAHCYSPGKRS